MLPVAVPAQAAGGATVARDGEGRVAVVVAVVVVVVVVRVATELLMEHQVVIHLLKVKSPSLLNHMGLLLEQVGLQATLEITHLH